MLVLLAACGGPEAPPAVVRVPIGPAAPADGSGDAIVARVNGQPVWASCVARQGLKACEDFELLAQAAAARGIPEDREAADAALVNRLIATDFERTYAEPASVAALVDQKLRSSGEAAGHEVPEGRSFALLRVTVPKDGDDAAAHEVAESLVAPLRGRTGLFSSDLVDAAATVTGGPFKVEASTTGLRPKTYLDKTFADALFALPAVGVVSEPLRTKWGWDIILATEIQPAHLWTREELVAKSFPDLRRAQFGPWVDAISARSHIPVTYFPDFKTSLEDQR